MCLLSVVWTQRSEHFEVSVSADGQTVPSVSDSSVRPDSPNGKYFFSPFRPLFFHVKCHQSDSREQRKTSAGQMMSFIDKLTASPPTEGPCHRFVPRLVHPFTVTARSLITQIEMNQQTTDLIFFDWKQSVFRCSESSRSDHFLFLMCWRRNDTNCI